MDRKRLVLIGAGGHAKSIGDCIDTLKFELIGFIDGFKTGTHMGLPIFGRELEDIPNYQNCAYFVAIGDNYHRKQWYEKLASLKLEVINIIDETAIISSTAKIGKGNFIGKYAVINSDTLIGDNNVINTKALVEHECIVGNNIHLSTNSTINGNVIVEDDVFFGSVAVCNGQLRIGKGAVIGSGAAIIRDVESMTTVVGVPGKVVKRNKDGKY